eukprot:COSAG01_NODE_2417_length_7736_cov_7.862511_7_plen_160_part_00
MAPCAATEWEACGRAGLRAAGAALRLTIDDSQSSWPAAGELRSCAPRVGAVRVDVGAGRCDEVPCPAHATARPALTVRRRPWRPLWRPSVLAEIYLCHVCSSGQERLRRSGRAQPALGRLERRPRWLGQQCHCDAGYSGALGWDASSARWVVSRPPSPS